MDGTRARRTSTYDEAMSRAEPLEPRRALARRRKRRQRRLAALIAAAIVAVVTLAGLELGGAFSSGPRVSIADPGSRALPAYPIPIKARDPGPVTANARERINDGLLAQIPAGLAVAHAGRGAREVALTFDDGPSPYTLSVLRTLARAHQHATFFVTGYAASANPWLLRQIRASGDAFGDHTVTHHQLLRETPKKRRWELVSTAQRVQAATGVHPSLFRPPYGSSSRAINRMARELGMLPITWSVDSKDWTRPGVKQIVKNALVGAHPGGIILMHDGGGDRSETVKALRLILKALAKRHLRSVTLPDLLNAQAPGHGDLEVQA
jgi:peptidoglycan/xylan/chitin deacetylase (PgdA/CDA1 family)